MPNILDLINSVDQKLKSLKNVEEARRKAERYRRRIQNLTTLYNSCTGIAQSAAALQAQKIPFTLSANKGIKDFLAEHGKLSGKQACQKICNEDFLSEADGLKSSFTSAEAALKTAWQRFAVAPLDGEKVAKIGKVFGDAKTRSSFLQIANECTQISHVALTLPRQEKDVRKAKELKSKVESEIEDMKSKGIDKEVLEFLLNNVTPGKTTSLKAAFAKPSVKKWLLSDDHADHFQLIVTT